MGLYIVNLDSVTTARSSRDCIKMTRIFIGGLPEDASRTELEREFEYFGRLKDVWVARNPPGFGFIVFDDARDAEDAVKEMDGKRVCGTRIRVEYACGPTRGGGRGGSRGGNSGKCYTCGRFGHSSRECRSGGGGGRRRRSRSRRDRSSSRDRNRERSTERRSQSKERSRSKSPKEEHSPTPERKSRERSTDEYSQSKERSQSRSRSRSRSPSVQNDEPEQTEQNGNSHSDEN